MKISVIIPVFNMEKYLDRCIQSILNQSYQDYEVWLVDDGSTDRSVAVCDRYAKGHPNVHVIVHSENRGLSHTRNTGINAAAGEFVTYVDSDDYVVPDYLECLYRTAESGNADIACGGFRFFSDNGAVAKAVRSGYRIRSYSGVNACKALLYEKDFHTSSCNMLIRKDIARKILFPEGRYHEDEMTTFRYFLNAKSVSIIDKPLYYYYQREDSITHTFGQSVTDELFAAGYYVDVCKDISRSLQKAAEHKKFSLITAALTQYKDIKNVYPDLYGENMEYLKNNAFNILTGVHSSFRNRRTALLLLFDRAEM